MNYGLDTGFLVAVEVTEHALHASAQKLLAGLIRDGHRLSLAPQVLAEFVHVVTDERRFDAPLSVDVARNLAEQWWTASEVDHVAATSVSVEQFFKWHREHRLGRKRLLDTMLAATFLIGGVRDILTTNPRDFVVFGEFNCTTP